MMKIKTVLGVLAASLVSLYPTSAVSNVHAESVILTSENLIVINRPIDGESVSQAIEDAKRLNEKLNSSVSEKVLNNKTPLYLFLNTPGGSVQAGLELIEALHGLDRPVHTVTLYGASMGFQIVQNLGTRHVLRNGVLMSHRARGQFVGEFGGQNPSQLESRLNFWKSRIDEMDLQTVLRSMGKQSLESYRAAYASEMWITGTQAVEQGYADSIVKVKCDSSLSGTIAKQDILDGFLPVDYELSKCPINTSPINVKVSFNTTKGLMSLSEFIHAAGEFGHGCLLDFALNPDRLCALDTGLSPEKILEIQNVFKQEYEQKQRQVVYMSF